MHLRRPLRSCAWVRQDAGLQLTQAAQLAQEFSVDARRTAPAPDGSSAPLLRLTIRWAHALILSRSFPFSSAQGPSQQTAGTYGIQYRTVNIPLLAACVHPAAGCDAGSIGVVLRHAHRCQDTLQVSLHNCTQRYQHWHVTALTLLCRFAHFTNQRRS